MGFRDEGTLCTWEAWTTVTVHQHPLLLWSSGNAGGMGILEFINVSAFVECPWYARLILDPWGVRMNEHNPDLSFWAHGVKGPPKHGCLKVEDYPSPRVA